jgi:hypothetical protein
MKYRLTNYQSSSKIGDETIILNHQEGVYFGLEEVGTFVWAKLQTAPHSLDELIDAICAEYETDPSEAKADLEGLLADLMKEKLVETV